MNKPLIEILLKKNTLIERIELSGLSYEDALSFYCRKTGEDIEKVSTESKKFVKWLVNKAEGNPLLIELVIDQYRRGDSGDKSLLDRYRNCVYIEELKQVIMNDIETEVATSGFLQVGSVYLDVAGYDTLLCMSYLTRRFTKNILQWIVNHGFIRLRNNMTSQDIIDVLYPLFFIKVYESSNIRLHDEMARMVQQYLFPNFGYDLSGERRRDFQQAIARLYDELIQTEEQREKNESDSKAKQEIKIKIAQLQAERLYYMLEYGRTLLLETKTTEGLEQAYDYFIELTDYGDEEVYKHLPREMLRVLQHYPKERQQDIYEGLAEIQQRLDRLSQAELYWSEAIILSDEPAEQVEMLLKIHNMVWSRNLVRSLQEILPQARNLAEKSAPEKLPDVLYEIGFTYGKLQEVDEAIEYYRQALKSYDEFKLDNPERKATLLNDLGFAVARTGQYEEGQELVGEGRKLREKLYEEARSLVDKLSVQFEFIPRSDDQHQALESKMREAEGELHRAAFRLGMTHSTEGEIARYNDELVTALEHYDAALRLVQIFERNSQIALIQNRRGEALRRMARKQQEIGNNEKRDEFARRAHEAIDESLYLKEKYDLELTDMMERRKGRLYHDQAIWAIQEGRLEEAQDLLKKAQEQFEFALASARKSENWLEILENEAELLFLQDDWVEFQEKPYDLQDVEKALERFQSVLNKVREKGEKFYQLEVYDYLYEIEAGAYYHKVAQQSGRKEDYDQALEHFVEGYLGMATSPGYGYAQFRRYLSQLRQHIRDIDNRSIAIEWCKRFLDELQKITVSERSNRLTKNYRDFIGWLFEHIQQRDND